MTEPLPLLPSELRYDYAGRCWWCGGLADSREHKWKRTDLVRMFGPGSYSGGVAWGRGTERRDPQGAGASDLKFGANLCRRCNNERSQPFDRAYDVWATWVASHLETLPEMAAVDLTAVYGLDAHEPTANLTRYFVKHIACRLADEGVEVPPDFIAHLNGNPQTPSSLRAGFGVRLDLLDYVGELKRAGLYETPGLWMRPLLCWYSPSAKAVVEVWSGISLGPFEFWYWLRLCDSAAPDFAQCFESSTVPLLRYYDDGPVKRASTSYRPGGA